MSQNFSATMAFDREHDSPHRCYLAFTCDLCFYRLSLYHKDHPFEMWVNGEKFGVEYWPGDSRSSMFGGNSNWRGVWL